MIHTDNTDTLKNALAEIEVLKQSMITHDEWYGKCNEVINLSAEIERLRGEIAILREVVECADSLIQFQYTGSQDAMSRLFVLGLDAKTALEDTKYTSWLTDHDAKVRNDALEDAAYHFNKKPSYEAFGDTVAEEIRTLKSKEE
ncbi:MAG: hypothetical protein PHP57_13815 [Sideroxydans sp.]|nr:hypothetical protein [Sideroxydans sp.]